MSADKEATANEASQICENCQEVFDNFHRLNEFYEKGLCFKYYSICSLEDSAQAGCQVCFLFFNSLTVNEVLSIQSSAPDESKLTVPLPIIENSGFLELVFPGVVTQAAIRFVPTSEHDTSPNVGIVAETTDCPKNWKLIDKWLSNCLSNHQVCCRSIITPSLPTRLVYVGSGTSEVRLSLSRDLLPSTKYLTLSHCWGLIEMKKLTTKTLPSMLVSINNSTLTKTFQDAIDITRRLGYEYIWIDSLCIIQDSKEDWQHESQLMAQVYANSSLNISAASAKNGNVGCFVPRQPGRPLNYRVSAQVGASGEKMFLDCLPRESESMIFKERPLMTRGWVTQEIHLSPRALYFGDRQLLWECRESRACESFPVSFDDESNTSAGTLVDVGLEVEEWWIRVWSGMTRTYSKCHLTYGSDKLIAFSGLARIFASRTNHRHEYLAGLWTTGLEKQLCWQVIEDGGGCRPPGYRAPSWSWASIDGACSLPSDIRLATKIFSTVESAVTVPSFEDKFGSVSDGHLKIRSSAAFYIDLGGPNDGTFSTYYFRHDLGNEKVAMQLVFPDASTQTLHGETVLVLPIVSSEDSPYLDPEDRRVHGIILQLATTMDRAFTRVGGFEIIDKRISDFHSVRKAARASKQTHYLGETTGKVDEYGDEEYVMTVY